MLTGNQLLSLCECFVVCNNFERNESCVPYLEGVVCGCYGTDHR